MKRAVGGRTGALPWCLVIGVLRACGRVGVSKPKHVSDELAVDVVGGRVAAEHKRLTAVAEAQLVDAHLTHAATDSFSVSTHWSERANDRENQKEYT